MGICNSKKSLQHPEGSVEGQSANEALVTMGIKVDLDDSGAPDIETHLIPRVSSVPVDPSNARKDELIKRFYEFVCLPFFQAVKENKVRNKKSLLINISYVESSSFYYYF